MCRPVLLTASSLPQAVWFSNPPRAAANTCSLSPVYRNCNGSVNHRCRQCLLCKRVLQPELICLGRLETDVSFGDNSCLQSTVTVTDRRVLGRAQPKTAELPHEGSPYRSTNHSRALSFSTEAALSRLLCCNCHPVGISWVMRSSKPCFITSLVVGYCTETVIKKRGRPRTRLVSVPYTKVGEKGVPLRGQSRDLVCRVRNYFQREKINKGPILPVEKVIPVTELDAFQKDAIRRHVYGFFVRREYPTVRKLQLTKEGLERETESDWKKLVDYTKNIILDAWKNEGLMEDSVEQMVINIGNDSSSEEDSDSDSSDNEEEERCSNVSGIFPLSTVAERVLDFDEL
ncbi:hypothetical protein J6590_066035 [Homalodisca vitripennis]|nr:hypothetical protein J6590_066035 [Homalodisca vitripennis]